VCVADGTSASSCASICGTETADGEAACYSVCTATDTSASSCASICGTQMAAGEDACFEHCAAMGTAASSCASICASQSVVKTAALCPLASAFRRPECLHSKPLPQRVPRRPTSILCGSLILQASLVDVPGGYSYSTASVALVAAGALPASLSFTRSRTLHLIQAIVGTGALVSAVLWLSQR
jgi:hypothetical protein